MPAGRHIGVYLHIPFCRQRCHFCAFYLEVARRERMDAFCKALRREIALHAAQDTVGGRSLITIYVGGGTPTALPVDRLLALLGDVRSAWSTDGSVEITIEAHPDTVTAEDLHALRAGGVNRLSFGAESMNQDELRAIGRPGTVERTAQAVARAKAAGFSNINLDLMYGLPGQTLATWAATLEGILALDPSHVSCYALTIDDGSALAEEVTRGTRAAPDESLQIDMEAIAQERLRAAGFAQYELSNYAKPGHACRHNLLYWTDQDYLALGPSGQSYVGGARFGNAADLTFYIEELDRGVLPVTERAVLSRDEQRREALVWGLRLTDGVSIEEAHASFEQLSNRGTFDRLLSRGFLETSRGQLRLTPLGRRYADTVAAELF